MNEKNDKPLANRRVGFIGLGAMGGPMVNRLLDAGCTVTVADVDPRAVAHAVARGAVAVANSRDAASASELVFVSLPTPSIVEQVAVGIAEGTGRLYVDLSTTGSTVAQRVAGILEARGIACLDAPISGGVAGAQSGTLAIMASGAHAAFEQAEPFLKILGKNIFHVGLQVGQGQIVKLANNLLGASTMVATAEAVALGVRAGLDPKQMLDVINTSTGRSFTTEVMFERMVLSGVYNVGFRTELMNKDIRLCLQEAEALGMPMWSGSATAQIWNYAMTQGLAKEDCTTICKLFGRWAGVDWEGLPPTDPAAPAV